MSQALQTHRPILPSPSDRPEADIVIFDGQCRICTSQIHQLARMDRGQRLAYLSLHDPEVVERFPDLTHETLMQQMVVVDRQGRRHGGAAAVRYLSRRLPLLWWAAPILNFPGSLPLWRWLYGWIAKRRYRFGRRVEGCENDACELHRR